MSAPIDVVQAFYAGVASGDLPAAVRTLHPQVVWTEAAGFPLAGTYRGPDAVVENVFARMAAQWDDFAAVPDQFVGDDGRVAVLGWYSGVDKCSGKAFRARFVHWFTVADGLITEFEQVTDTVPVQQARA